MEPTVVRWSNAQDFLGAAADFLAAREAEHCLMQGLAGALTDHPALYPDARLWTVLEAGRVVGAALRTPPHNLVLSMIDEPRWVQLLAADVLGSDDPPGVLGPTAAARALADAWQGRAGRAAERVARERIFRLDRVVPPRPAPGRCRAAEERDRGLLEAWLAAFFAEALPHQSLGDMSELADRYLRRRERTAYLWDDGEVVALAATVGPTPHGIRIGPVYTPPDRRGHGYASNLVAAVSQQRLDAGRRFCFLFTDLTNPTSNHIYQAIGYVPVVDVDQYRFP